MTNIKRIFSLLLALMLVVAVFTFTASAAVAHEEHIDKTGDGICDVEGCSELLPCTSHFDLDGDGKCDYKGCDEAVAPVEEEPENTIGTEKYTTNIIESLKMMGLGMLGIFIVTGIIILVIYALNHFTNREPKENTEEN